MSATDLAARQGRPATQKGSAGGNTLDRGHERADAQNRRAPVNPLPADHRRRDDQTSFVGGNPLPAGHRRSDAHRTGAGRNLHNGLLLILADAVEDLERVRIATSNRLRALADEKGLADSPEYERMVGMLSQLEGLEHDATLQLRRAMRAHPLGPFVRRTVGLGEKQAARLIAAIGDPYWNDLEDRPRRGPAELWAYCGYHVVKGVAARRERGARANWSSAAKMRAYLIAESCVKQSRSPYRVVYDAARAKYADSTHDAPCRRCGPAGKPAATGSPLGLGHQHARALRIVAKEILKDLWRESKTLHEAAA